MRKSKRMALAAAAAAVTIARSSVHAATSYTWTDLAGGTQSWTDATQWTPSGSPLGAAGAGDSANLNVGLTSNLLVNVPTGTYYVDNLKLGSTAAAVTTDIGNNNSGGGTLILDGGTPNAGAYADIYSLGAAGNTNIISAPIELDQNSFSTQTLNTRSGSDGNYDLNANGSVSSATLGPLQTALLASAIIDPSSTNNLILNGTITQAVGVSAAICNLMTNGQTLTINGGISISNASSTVAQTFTLAGNSLSTTIVNGVISDGAVGISALSMGYSNPTKTTVYPAISPTIELNGINTYTGDTTVNMSTVIVGSNQAFGVLTATATVGSSEGEIRMGGSSNEFGYNLESANDLITINNGVDVSEDLTIEGSHSITFDGYMYQTVNREMVNLLPAGKTMTINGPVYIQSTTQGRTWVFDGSGMTVVNGSIHNSFADDTSITGAVTKNGTGVVLANGTAGTYQGATVVNGGLLEFAAPGAYGVQTGDSGTSSITVNAGGAVALDTNTAGTAGTTDSSFLGLIASSSTGALALSSLDSAANLNFTTGTLANLASMSVGSDNAGVTYTGTITPANSTYRLGGGGTLTIPNSGGNALTGGGNSLLVTNGGSVAVGGSNNYGGITTIQGVYVISDQTRAATNDYSQPVGAFEPATLSVNQLANGGAATGSGIGSASNAASNLVLSGGTLQYTGAATSTDRLFTLTPTGGTLDASGTGAVDFTNAGTISEVEQAPITGVTITASSTGVPFNFVSVPSGVSTSMLAIGMTVTDAQSAFAAGSTIVGVSSNGFYINNNVNTTVLGDTLTFSNQSRALTLTGTNTGQNILSAKLGDSATGKLSVVKTGAGTWALTGNNTYSGGTTVNAGTLDVSNVSGSATGTGNVTMNGGVLASDSGSISGNVIAGSGSHTIAPGGIGSIGTLSIGGLTSSSLTTLNFDLGTGSGVVTNGDLLVLGSGTVSIANGTHLSFGGSPVGGDDYRLIGGSIGGITLGNLALPAASGGETYALSSSADPGFIDLVVTGGGPVSLTWNDASADNLWNTTSSNWNNGSGSTTYADPAAVTFNDNNGGNYNVTLNTTVNPASVTVNNTSGSYTLSGTGRIAGTAALTKSGNNTLTLKTVNTYTGGTNVSAGTLVVGATGALPSGAVNITGGTLQLATSTGLATVTTLAISGTGAFDVNNNHVIINYGSGTDPIASIAALLKTGFNGGHWNGPGGITSTAAATNTLSYGLGYADSADAGNPANLSSGNIEIKYTLLGDANLDGTVNGIDFGILAANFNKGVTGWDKGDFNYDNVVSGIDFGDLAANFNKGASGASIGEPAYEDPAILAFAQANGLLADVPEPASMGLIASGAVGLMARRRRKA